MSRREALASGLAEKVPRPSGSTVPSGPVAAPPGSSRLRSWEETFLAASQEQQQELLALAQTQGLIYAHQIPKALNGTEPASGPLSLSQLLSGQTDSLEPLRCQPVAVHDVQLDLNQREAVARAVQTQDICLIQGLPGTGKSRVVTEIITHAVARAPRLLLVPPPSPPLNRL